MKITKFIFNILTLISSIICLYTIVSIALGIEPETNLLDILLFNLFVCPVLTIMTCIYNLNKEESKDE